MKHTDDYVHYIYTCTYYIVLSNAQPVVGHLTHVHGWGVPSIGCQDLSINGFQSRDRGHRMTCIVFNSAFRFACDKASWFCGFAPKAGMSWELAL